MVKLKFRGMSVENLASGAKWIYGSDVYVNYDDERAYINDTEVLFNTVGQFIWELDRDDNEIYEDDLLEIQNGPTEEYRHFLARVHRHGSSFNFTQPTAVNSVLSEPIPYFVRNTGRVLGNIHEDKEKIIAWENKIRRENKFRAFNYNSQY